MHGNQLTFSRSGDRRRLYGVNPLLFPQYTAINGYFLPDEHELPSGGPRFKFTQVGFDFGFSDPSLVIAPYDSVPFPVTLAFDFLATTICGVSDVLGVANPAAAGAQANVLMDPSYLINFQHTHLGVTRQWMSKAVTNSEAVGTGQHPSLFRSPVLIPKGDTLTCIVQNMLNAQTRVQILLTGGAFD